jgi:hypothetical protein
MNLLDQLPPPRNMPSNRQFAARKQLTDIVDHPVRSRWHLGRSATIALVVGLMVTGSAAAGVLSSPTPTTIPAGSAAITPPPGAQPASGVAINPAKPLVPMGAPTVSTAATTACNESDLEATLGGSGPYNLNLATSQQIVTLSATRPCYVSGFAQLHFLTQTGTTVETSEVEGDYLGQAFDVSNVSLGLNNFGSFLFQYVGTQNGSTSSCPLETSLNIEFPNQSLTVSVLSKGVALLVCGTVNVSPVIQGNSVDRYVP